MVISSTGIGNDKLRTSVWTCNSKTIVPIYGTIVRRSQSMVMAYLLAKPDTHHHVERAPKGETFHMPFTPSTNAPCLLVGPSQPCPWDFYGLLEFVYRICICGQQISIGFLVKTLDILLSRAKTHVKLEIKFQIHGCC